jgi:triphosphoribosyl-dephospho-CoA synthetase
MEMLTDKEVWHIAGLLIEKCGTHAAEAAEERAQEALDEDNVSLHAQWLTIAGTVRELLRSPCGDREVN